MPNPSKDETVSINGNGIVRVSPTRLIVLLVILVCGVAGVAGKLIYADVTKRCDDNEALAKAAGKLSSDSAAQIGIINEQIKQIMKTVDKIDDNVSELLKRK